MISALEKIQTQANRPVPKKNPTRTRDAML